MPMELTTGPNDEGRRLDRVLRKVLPDCPLSLLHRLLRQGRVLVNGSPAGPASRIAGVSRIVIAGLPPMQPMPPKQAPAKQPPPSPAGQLPPVLWQGGGIIVFNKPAGLPVHGPHSLDTLVNACLSSTLPHSLSFKPGPLHRLDQMTSGIIVFSTNLEGATKFSSLMRERKLRKTYLALVEGCLEQAEVWQDSVYRDKTRRKTVQAGQHAGGLSALTTVRPLAVSAGDKPAFTLLLAEIETGRTHQIRAQSAARGHPLAGDIKYGGHALNAEANNSRLIKGERFFLHAWMMALGETETVFPQSIVAPVPPDMRDCIADLFGTETAAMLDTSPA